MKLLRFAGTAVLALIPLALGLEANASFQSSTPAAPTAPQSTQTPIHVETNLQSLAVRVTDQKGNEVPGLAPEDFVVLEDGRPQKIDFFGQGSVPTSLAVLVDSSSSMDPSGRPGSAEAIAARFLRSARPGDEISAMDFTDQVGLFQMLSADQIVNSPAIQLAAVTSHGSALYDAVATAICHLRTSKNLQRAIVVISDGVDQHSRITLGQLVNLVQSSPIQLFMIGLNSKSKYNFDGKQGSKLVLVTGHEIDNPPYVFDLLAKESGAEARFLKKEEDLGLALKDVSDILRAQYTIAYYPQSVSKAFRKIEVRVNRPGVKVASRRAVGSPNAASDAVCFTEGTCTISARNHAYPFESKVKDGPKGKVYHEDFSDAQSGWPNRPNSVYGINRYQITNPLPPTAVTASQGIPFNVKQNAVAAYGPWWQDFRASVLVESEREESPSLTQAFNSAPPLAGPSSAGLVFRLNDEGYYALLLTSPRKGSEASFKIVKMLYRSNSPVEITKWTSLHVPRTNTSRLKLSVQCVGSQITVFVNDQEVGHAQDPTYSQGYAGLIVWGYTRGVFRDLLVEEIH
jgi:Ca-activated chloride channel homolog